MTATMILKEIQALPAEEKDWLFKKLDRTANGSKNVSESELLRIIENIGKQMRTSLSAEEMSAARLEGRK
jgi:Ca2+-binding EF-hand superfamily protein